MSAERNSNWIKVERPEIWCAEGEFQNAVNRLAAKNGWLIYHTHNSKRSQPGFPDLVALKDGFLVFAELKRERNAKLTDAQALWLSELEEIDEIQVELWRPSDWDKIVETFGA